jgi:hypothetical protein
LITRLESCTREAARRAASPGATGTSNVGGRVRAYWDLALGVCAVAYLTLVLFDDVESPLLSLALIILVTNALLQPHLRNR